MMIKCMGRLLNLYIYYYCLLYAGQGIIGFKNATGISLAES